MAIHRFATSARRIEQVYELHKGTLKLVHERETDAGIKCCTFGASSLEDRNLVRSTCALLVEPVTPHDLNAVL